jgi:thiol-disulfide isomerase/thioredoxin
MIRLSVQSIRHRLLIAVTAAASAVVLLLVSLEYGFRVLSPETAVRQPAPATFSTGSASDNQLELSVFDQPHALPEVRFQDDQDRDLTLGNFRGRVVVLNVWATWCVPCRKEMSTLDRLQARLGGKDFLVVALSIDRKGVEAVRGFYQEVGVENLAIYLDPSGRGSRGLGLPGVPTTLLIDQEGHEVARKMGEAEWDGPEMASWLSGRCMDTQPGRRIAINERPFGHRSADELRCS